MNYSEEIKEVRNRSHASLGLCSKAVEEAGGDVERALKILQEKGVISGAGRARVAAEGRAQAYVHQDAQLTVLVEINCETDFAARSEHFKAFCDLVAMQIAAMSPTWIARADVPAKELEAQTAIYNTQFASEGKPEKIREKIVAGKIEKWFGEVCLSEQKAVASETPNDTIETLRALLSSKLGETITIRRFVRWQVGEGIEKVKKADYAAEIAVLAAD